MNFRTPDGEGRSQNAARRYKIFAKVKEILNERFGQQLLEMAKQYQEEVERQEVEIEKMGGKG